jgi:hypothetical protein
MFIRNAEFVNGSPLVMSLYFEANQPILLSCGVEDLRMEEHLSRSVTSKLQLLALVQLYHSGVLKLEEVVDEALMPFRIEFE